MVRGEVSCVLIREVRMLMAEDETFSVLIPSFLYPLDTSISIAEETHSHAL